MIITILETLKGKTYPTTKNYIAHILWQEGIFGGLTDEPDSLPRVLAYLTKRGYMVSGGHVLIHDDAGSPLEESFTITLKGLWKLKSLQRGRLG